MNTRYRLYTQSFSWLTEEVSRYFEGATLYQTTGLWRGQKEESAVIEILGTSADLQNVVYLAANIKERGHQQSVLVTTELLPSVVEV